MSSLLSTESFAQISFWVVVGFIMAGAILSVFPLNILYNVLGLALALTGIAGLYLYLGSFFMAMMQLLIYVGAICIAIVFAIMLSRPLHVRMPKLETYRVVVSFLASGVFLAAMTFVILKTTWAPTLERGGDWSVAIIGHLLLTRYDLVFEVISLVLLIAIVGAIVTAGYSRRFNE